MVELADPETLRERDGVDFIDVPPEEHQHHFELYKPLAGMAIVGVVDEAGRLLLLEHDQQETPVLSYTRVDHDEDWVAAARGIIESETGTEATIDEPVRVRHHTYRSETDEETTGYDVVFAATPETTAVDPDAAGDWTAVWRETTTLDLPGDADNDVVNDIRLFVE